MLMNDSEEFAMPYYFCIHCLRLSPTSGDVLDNLVCLICGMTLDYDSAGRKVVLTKDEAVLRNLPWSVK